MIRRSAVWIITIIGLCAAISGCNNTSAPAHQNAWLSYKYGFNCGTYFNNPQDLNGQSATLSTNCPGLSDFVEVANYYEGIGAPTTFTQWLAQYGYSQSNVTNVEAVYGNFYDLRFGRDMDCWQNQQQQIACYVTNYGPPPSDCTSSSNCPWPDLETGVNDAIGKAAIGVHAPFATVAMVWNGTPNNTANPPANNVTFYVYNAEGEELAFAALDDEGAKSVPRMCMACHGGTYTPHTSTAPATVTGASFLPFDVQSFYYSKANPTFGLDAQQEAFRSLNLFVKTTNGGDQVASSQTVQQSAIVDFINGQYCPDLVNGGTLNPCPTPVEQPGSKAVAGYFPTGWGSQQKAYSEVVKPYCRMCHMAQIPTFVSSGDLTGPVIQNLVCKQKDMPHAEVPFGGPNSNLNPFIQQNDLTTHFWLDGTAVNDLQKVAGIASCQ